MDPRMFVLKRNQNFNGSVRNRSSLSIWQPKRTVLRASAVFSAFVGPLIVLADENMFPFPIVRYVLLIGIALLVLAWCSFDANERHQPFYPWMRVMILLIGVFALFIHLFKSRGLKN